MMSPERFGRLLWTFVLLGLLASCGPTLKQKKDESLIHFQLGTVYYREGDITGALKEYNTAVELYPEDATYHNALGLAYWARGFKDKAEKHFKEAIDLDPDYSEALNNLGALYIELERWDLAIEYCEAALKNIYYRTPEIAHNNIGWAYYRKGDYEKAVKHFKKAIEANPGYALAYNNMGLAYNRLDRPEKARRAFEKAIDRAPRYLDAYLNLGRVLAHLKEKEAALKAFEKVVELAPESDQALSAREFIDIIK